MQHLQHPRVSRATKANATAFTYMVPMSATAAALSRPQTGATTNVTLCFLL